MPTSYTSLLGLALPVTGELSGTWGDTVNNYITQYVDAAVAGAQTISGSQTAVTLSTTTNAALSQAGSGATGSAQYQIINCTGNPASALTVTVPSASKVYLVLNNTSTNRTVTVKGAATTGVTVAAARAALIAWNGTDFELVATDDISKMNGILAVANGGTGLSSGTSGGVPYFSGSTTIASSAALAANALVVGGGAGAAPSTITTGTGVVTALGVNTGTAGAFVVNGGALGTPSSGTVTNLTGTAAININGTVGATTPNTGAFTSVTSTSASGILTRAAATQDGVELIGRAGGTTSLKVTQTPTTLTASRTVTWPDADVNFTTGLAVANGGTGSTSASGARTNLGATTVGANFFTLTNPSAITFPRINADNTVSALDAATFRTAIGAGTGGGTVTSVSWTGGIVSVANGTTTPAFTIAGTSGGIPYFSSASTWATSAALAANALVVGGGAGVAPSTITTGTGVVTALGVNTGTAGAFVVNGGALGTPSSGTLTNATGLPLSTGVTGTLPTGNGGTGVTTTPAGGQLLIGNGSGYTVANLTAGSGISIANGLGSITITASGGGVTSITGTTNQVIASASTGAVTLSTPQSIATSSSVQFGSFGVGTAASGTTGEIRATNNVTAYYSDDRLKTRLGVIENALAKVKALNGFYYKANETAQALGYESVKEVGLSAQETQAVLPEIVVPAPIDDKYLTIRYEKMVPLLVEAIKELAAEIEQLKAALK